MSKDYYLRCGEITGIAQALTMQRIMAEAMEYLAIKKAVDDGAHKAYDMTAKEYIRARLGNRSYETYNRRKDEMGLLGADLWGIKKYMGWGPAEVQALAALPEGEKAKVHIKGDHIEVGDRKIPFEKHAIQESFCALLNRAESTEKNIKAMERVNESLHKTMDRLERETSHKISELEKEIAAREPAATDEERKKRFEEQLDLAYKHLAEAGQIMNTRMDFSLVLNDRELAIKYRGAVKAVTALADNLERKIGEV